MKPAELLAMIRTLMDEAEREGEGGEGERVEAPSDKQFLGATSGAASNTGLRRDVRGKMAAGSVP
jgi:hypothetical protein